MSFKSSRARMSATRPPSRSAPRWRNEPMAARLGTSILVVEDEPAIQELLRLSLGEAGCDVHAVAAAEGAHAEIRRALPDLVLLDWMLPGQSGLALARTLRADARTRDLPLIFLTARADEADKIGGLAGGGE